MMSGDKGEANQAASLGQSFPGDLVADLVNAARDGLALFDANAALILCNQRYRELNPLVSELLVPGMAWPMLLRHSVQRAALSEDDASRLDWMESQLAADVPELAPIEVATLSGAIHRLSMRATSEGGFVLLHSDVTAEKLYAREDDQADILLRKVLEACPANIVMSRIGDGQILYRSPAATELLGTARCYYDHFASREERADFITALLPDGRVDDAQVTGLRADRSPFPCSISARIIEYHGEDVMVSNAVDISQELALRDTLAEQREQIFQAEKMSALGELLAGVAHELNNPLSVVVGHALMLREEATDRTALRRIEKISDAAERCARIVKSFLAMARQQPAQLTPVDLLDVLETAIDALRQGAAGLISDVTLDVPKNLPRLHADGDQIGQVFINLIANADQAIAESGVGGSIAISARHDSQNMVEVHVRDDGPGVPASIRKRIFDPLFTTKDVGRGTGIGLAFCHRVITSHNGHIALASGQERGATFIIRLPVTQPGQEDGEEPTTSAVPVHAERVLLIEDEADVAELIEEILRSEGLEVHHVATAEAALSILPDDTYKLILTDLNMPGLGGRGFYQRIARDHPALLSRIAFVTGDTMSPSARMFLDSAKRPCLEKPLSPEELRRTARKLLDDDAIRRPR